MSDDSTLSVDEFVVVRRIIEHSRARAVATRTGPERLFALLDSTGVVLNIMVTHDPAEDEHPDAPTAEEVAAHHASIHDHAERAVEVTDLEVHRGMRTPDGGETWLDERHEHLPRIHSRHR